MHVVCVPTFAFERKTQWECDSDAIFTNNYIGDSKVLKVADCS